MKLCGLGDNVVDHYVDQGMMYPGGNAFNVAVMAGRLGCQAAYLGVLGSDRAGRLVARTLKDEGIDTSHCRQPDQATTKVCDYTAQAGGQRVLSRVVTDGKWVPCPRLQADDIAYLEGFDAIHSSCNASLADQIALLRDVPGIVSFDFSAKEKYRTSAYLDMVAPYLTLAQFSCTDGQVDGLLADLRHYLIPLILITRGAGRPLICLDGVVHEGFVYPIEAVDAMGAGDCYCATVLTDLMRLGYRRGSHIDGWGLDIIMSDAAAKARDNCRQPGAIGGGQHD